MPVRTPNPAIELQKNFNHTTRPETPPSPALPIRARPVRGQISPEKEVLRMEALAMTGSQLLPAVVKSFHTVWWSFAEVFGMHAAAASDH
jgi:hypothetical protein